MLDVSVSSRSGYRWISVSVKVGEEWLEAYSTSEDVSVRPRYIAWRVARRAAEHVRPVGFPEIRELRDSIVADGLADRVAGEISEMVSRARDIGRRLVAEAGLAEVEAAAALDEKALRAGVVEARAALDAMLRVNVSVQVQEAHPMPLRAAETLPANSTESTASWPPASSAQTLADRLTETMLAEIAADVARSAPQLFASQARGAPPIVGARRECARLIGGKIREAARKAEAEARAPGSALAARAAEMAFANAMEAARGRARAAIAFARKLGIPEDRIADLWRESAVEETQTS